MFLLHLVKDDLASVIYEELQKIGATNVYYDKDTCVVYGSLEANVKSGRAIGFVTHMDTDSGCEW